MLKNAWVIHEIAFETMGGTSCPMSYDAYTCTMQLDKYEYPCDRDAQQQENFKNFQFFKNSLKILNVYFGGKNVYFWGNSVYFGGFSKIFGIFVFVAGWVFGLRGSGAPVGVFENI